MCIRDSDLTVVLKPSPVLSVLFSVIFSAKLMKNSHSSVFSVEDFVDTSLRLTLIIQKLPLADIIFFCTGEC